MRPPDKDHQVTVPVTYAFILIVAGRDHPVTIGQDGQDNTAQFSFGPAAAPFFMKLGTVHSDDAQSTSIYDMFQTAVERTDHHFGAQTYTLTLNDFVEARSELKSDGTWDDKLSSTISYCWILSDGAGRSIAYSENHGSAFVTADMYRAIIVQWKPVTP